jgi:hypothetical protein
MHPMIWFLIFAPPCLAFLIWQGIEKGFRTGNTVPWARVRLGKFGFWMTLAILYVATFAAALVLHKL